MPSLALIFAACMILFTGCGEDSEDSNESRIEFPDFKYETPDGKKYSNKDIQRGSVVVGFLVSWCVPCAGELLALQEIHDEFGKHHLSVFVFTYEEISKFDKIVDSLGIDIPIIRADSSLFSAMKIDAIPTRIFFHNSSEIRRMIGTPNFEEEDFRREIAETIGIKIEDSASSEDKSKK